MFFWLFINVFDVDLKILYSCLYSIGSFVLDNTESSSVNQKIKACPDLSGSK